MLLNIFLTILAIIGYLVIQPINFFYVVLIKNKKENVYSRMSGYFRRSAIDIDRFGNSTFKGILNRTLINKDYRESETTFMFGDYHETISSCLGKNQCFGTLTKFGLFVANALDLIDTNHCIKSIKVTPRDLKSGIDYNFWKIYTEMEFGLKDVIQKEHIYE